MKTNSFFRGIGHQTLLYTVVFSLLLSCSFDHSFLKPTSFSRAQNRIVAASSSDTTVLTISGRDLQPSITKTSDNGDLSETSIKGVTFISGSGNNLNGWLLSPVSKKAITTIIHLHGNGGFMLSHLGFGTSMVKQGYQVFMFDYSGFGYSSGEATRENSMNDALSAIDFVLSMPEVAGTKIVLYGQSFGGHLAPMVAGERLEKIDVLVLEGAFTSYPAIAGKQVPLLGPVLVKGGNSALKSIPNITIPVLIIHSREDKVIPFRMGEKLYEKASEPREFMAIDGCHICGPSLYPEEISKKIDALVDSY
ncbi:alpha/beta hydrolase [Fulvivirga sedimenti]|uniref:Alpha/beta hydrolase n=1 Tax=Fulvivirga sedimenti TaxID=2879465 RepID=A0A9X1HQJ1_9BACT|nr:alpha/beta fold hydrolase [Fulvivirga sedimenti]MCA6075128.1 alpha/beta hydrolase [Fulvivirga sedimenti]MCA6076305.1 alpha/beta hydrolase [Fulvivirga sedimenti]MCA6077433.1 alpha/beta hydrolase [Fulvivirga sedimenti]